MTHREFTLADLRRILIEGAGTEEESLGDDSVDAEFEELGIESLALLETGSRIEREYGITLEDSAITDARTPRALIDVVNAHLRPVVA